MDIIPSSLPSTEASNLEKYWDIIRKVEPEFYLLRIALSETGVNPLVLPRVIRAISNLHLGTRYGKITIYMQNGRITTIEGQESDKIEAEAIVDKSQDL